MQAYHLNGLILGTQITLQFNVIIFVEMHVLQDKTFTHAGLCAN